mgnify:CR=1 FL=1
MAASDNWKTLRVPPEAYDRAKAQKEDHNRTWGEQLVRPDDDGRVMSHELAEEIVEEIAMVAEPDAGLVDDTELAHDIARQVDYSELAARVADELEGRMR